MKVFDCFMFFNEFDLLDLRLNYLNDSVDYFVLVESNKTHSGQDKPYHYEENKERFKNFQDKIIHVKHPLNTDGLTFEKRKFGDKNFDNYWKLENEQRNGISNGLKSAKEDDIIMISDVDEIPNKKQIIKYKKQNNTDTVRLIQSIHYYYFNCKMKNNNWLGTIISRNKNITTPQELRDNKNFKQINNGGWHFSFLGGVDDIILKLKSFAHSECSYDSFLEKDKISKNISDGKDILNRKLDFIYFDLNSHKDDYPDYLINNQELFDKHIKKIEI